MRKTNGAGRRRRGGGQRTRGGSGRGRGEGTEVKAEQGEVVVPHSGDWDGDGDEDGKGDEVQVEPPPLEPLLHPFLSGCKRPSGKTQRSAAKQPLPPGLPESLNRAVGQTNRFFATPRVATPCARSCTDFSSASLGKMERARGSGGRLPRKGGPRTSCQCRVVPCAPWGRR